MSRVRAVNDPMNTFALVQVAIDRIVQGCRAE